VQWPFVPDERNTMDTDANSRAALWSLIKDIRFALFTTRFSDGTLRSHPMTLQNSRLDEDDRLWFFMSRRSHSVEDIANDPQVHVGFADTDKDQYVSVGGTARVVDDKGKTAALWTKKAEAWFPGGPTDGDLALVEVQIRHAHYWDVKENKLVQLYKMAKAAITGKPPAKMGESGVVHMR
jgi:general stress protein 26